MIKKYKPYLIILPVFVLALIVTFTVTKKEDKEEIIQEQIIEKEEPKEELKTIKVDIKGEVNKPGVYELLEGKRVNDAINLSGGLTDSADTSLLNLSKTLKDEMVIIVYSKEKIEKLLTDTSKPVTIIEYIEKECICPDKINDACIKENKENNVKETKEDEQNGKININTATKEELLKVKGIGETKAEAIIKYREEKGLFKNIEDIKNISGIGDSTFEKIKDNITI